MYCVYMTKHVRNRKAHDGAFENRPTIEIVAPFEEATASRIFILAI